MTVGFVCYSRPTDPLLSSTKFPISRCSSMSISIHYMHIYKCTFMCTCMYRPRFPISSELTTNDPTNWVVILSPHSRFICIVIDSPCKSLSDGRRPYNRVVHEHKRQIIIIMEITYIIIKLISAEYLHRCQQIIKSWQILSSSECTQILQYSQILRYWDPHGYLSTYKYAS